MTCTALVGRTAVSVPPFQVIVPSTPQGGPCAQLVEPLAPNSVRAYRGDLAYFWAWARAALGRLTVYPVSVEEMLLFIEQHVQGLPAGVDAGLVREGAKDRMGAHAASWCSVSPTGSEDFRTPARTQELSRPSGRRVVYRRGNSQHAASPSPGISSAACSIPATIVFEDSGTVRCCSLGL